MVDKESDIAKLLFIKRLPPETTRLVRDIDAAADDLKRTLETALDDNPTLQLRLDHQTPALRVAQDAYEAETRGRLLGSTGRPLERDLLISQTQALSYIQHVAAALARSAPSPPQAQALQHSSRTFGELAQRARDQLQPVASAR